jgi:hypothetical protein
MPRPLLRLQHLCWHEGAVGIAPHDGTTTALPSLPHCDCLPPRYPRQPLQRQGGGTRLTTLQRQSIPPVWDTAASQEAESVLQLQLAFTVPCPLAPQPPRAPGDGGATTDPPARCHRREGPRWQKSDQGWLSGVCTSRGFSQNIGLPTVGMVVNTIKRLK